MGRPLYQRGIRLGKPCRRRFSTRQGPARELRLRNTQVLGPSNKFLSHEKSLAGNARRLRFAAAACLSLRRTPL